MRKQPREWEEKYPSVKKLYDSITGSRRLGSVETAEVYIIRLKPFVKFLGLNDPETALKAIKAGRIKAEEKIDEYIGYSLDTLEKSHSTVRGAFFAVKKWLELNGIDIDMKKIDMPTSTETREQDRAPTKEDLKKLLNHASSSRDRAVIFVASSSGLRIGTLLSLRVGDVDFNYPDVARISVERKRGRKFSASARNTGRYFVTWITPEAKEALKQHLAERESHGEKITPDSALIGDTYHKGHFQTLGSYQHIWSRLLKRSGLAEKSHNWFKLHIHTLRKYFRSNCIGVDASYRERWMGHKGLYLDASYFKAEENLHLAEYRKAVPYLTIYAIPTEEKKLKAEMLLNFAKLQDIGEDKIRKLEEILARAKDMDEAITEFKRLKDEAKTGNGNGNGKHIIAKGEPELLKRLGEGYSLVQSMNEDKFLLQKP